MKQASRSRPSGSDSAFCSHAVARLRYTPASQLSGMHWPPKTESRLSRSPAMDERELQAKAEHYKRIASLVTDEDISTALLELAAKYEAMAKSLRIEPPDRRE